MISCIDAMQRLVAQKTLIRTQAQQQNRSQRELQCRSKFDRQYKRWPNNTHKKNRFIQKQFPKFKTLRWPKNIFDLFFNRKAIYISHKRISNRTVWYMVQWEIIKSDIMLFIYIHCRLKTTSYTDRRTHQAWQFSHWKGALLVWNPLDTVLPEMFS